MNKLSFSNEAISIAVRDFFKVYHNFNVSVNKILLFLKLFCQMYNQTISDVLHEILHQIIFILPTRE